MERTNTEMLLWLVANYYSLPEYFRLRILDIELDNLDAQFVLEAFMASCPKALTEAPSTSTPRPKER